jgi:hypothetical protein
VLAALFGLVTSCAATAESNARDAFSEAFACPAERVVATPTTQPTSDASYVVVRVEGCGQRRTYACTSDWSVACARPNEVAPRTEHTANSAPGTSFPPTLVDQAPPPPPPVPDTQDGT